MRAPALIIGLLLIVIGVVAIVQGEIASVSIWFVAAAVAALGLGGLIKALQQESETNA